MLENLLIQSLIKRALAGHGQESAPEGPNWRAQHPNAPRPMDEKPMPVGPNWQKQQSTRDVSELPGYIMSLLRGGKAPEAAPVGVSAGIAGSGFDGKQTPYERSKMDNSPMRMPTLPQSPMKAQAQRLVARDIQAPSSSMPIKSPTRFSDPEGELSSIPDSYSRMVEAGIDPGSDAEEIGSGFVEGEDIPQDVVKAFSKPKAPKVGPTGPFAGNDQSSMISAVDLSGLPGEIDAPSAEVPALESSDIGMDRYSALPSGEGGRQFSAPDNRNLMMALLRKVF
jgi:hypothetical protein